MKVIFAVPSYWPSTGGVQTITQYMTEGLAQKGFDVIVATKQVQGAPHEEKLNGVRIVRFYYKSFLKYRYGDKNEYRSFIVEECSNADALIAICSPSFAVQWIFPIMDKIRCKKILYQHGLYDGRLHINQCYSIVHFSKQLILTPYWELYHRYYWKDILKFDACIHLFKNDSSYSYFKRKGYKRNYVIMNGCEDAFFNDIQPRDDILKEYNIERPYFLCVANYGKGKNQLKALRCYVKSGSCNTDLVFVGSTSNNYSKRLTTRAAKYNSKKGMIHILSGIPRNDVVSLIKKSYACILTSNKEHLPVCILESLACGHPFISSDVGVVGMLPGGHSCRKEDDLSYWIKYYEDNPEYVKDLGKEGADFAKKNCAMQTKIDELVRIILVESTTTNKLTDKT